VLVLDGVQDPGNLGTLARSAAAFGCDALVCLPGTVDPWNPKAVRASAGALFRRPVVQPTLSELWEWLDRHGYLLVGADAGGGTVTEASAAAARGAGGRETRGRA
jgi:RNA methyltransferase, TrmH family